MTKKLFLILDQLLFQQRTVIIAQCTIYCGQVFLCLQAWLVGISFSRWLTKIYLQINNIRHKNRNIFTVIAFIIRIYMRSTFDSSFQAIGELCPRIFLLFFCSHGTNSCGTASRCRDFRGFIRWCGDPRGIFGISSKSFRSSSRPVSKLSWLILWPADPLPITLHPHS